MCTSRISCPRFFAGATNVDEVTVVERTDFVDLRGNKSVDDAIRATFSRENAARVNCHRKPAGLRPLENRVKRSMGPAILAARAFCQSAFAPSAATRIRPRLDGTAL